MCEAASRMGLSEIRSSFQGKSQMVGATAITSGFDAIEVQSLIDVFREAGSFRDACCFHSSPLIRQLMRSRSHHRKRAWS